jgi:anti-sigma28 factor (negative regulator of flagellin synthesis)
MAKARKVIYQTPELRLDKLAHLKEAVEQSIYEIHPRKLAGALLTELIPLIFRFPK